MIKIKTLGEEVLVITHTVKFETLEDIQKYNPEKLSLKDDKGNETFKVAVEEDSEFASFSRYGVTFNKITTDGEAMLQFNDADIIDVVSRSVDKEVLVKKYHKVFANLNRVLEQVASTTTEMSEMVSSMVDDIEELI